MSNVEKKVEEVKGELTYEDKVIQKIIGLSLENVPGLLAIDGGFFSNLTEKLINTDNVASGVNVEVGKKQVAVDLKVVVEYQRNIPELYKKIKENSSIFHICIGQFLIKSPILFPNRKMSTGMFPALSQ